VRSREREQKKRDDETKDDEDKVKKKKGCGGAAAKTSSVDWAIGWPPHLYRASAGRASLASQLPVLLVRSVVRAVVRSLSGTPEDIGDADGNKKLNRQSLWPGDGVGGTVGV